MRARRGLSTVVGTVFAIIALTTTITYVSYSMGILDNYNQSVLTKNQQLTDVDKEKFQISSVTVPNNKLNITVVDTGNLPINFTKIWIQNTTTADWVRSYVPTHNFVAPGGVLTNIGQDSGVNINQAYSYNVKLVTSRGNTQQFIMNSPNVAPLNVQLLAIPNTIDIGFNSELVMVVTNNGSTTLVNVTPNTPTQTSGLAQCSLSQVSPASYSTLSPGSTAIFKWDVTVNTAANGQTCTFTSSPPLRNGYSGQSVSTTVTAKMVTFSQTLLAQNTGVLTINYTTFRFTQSTGQYSNNWYSGWNFTYNIPTAFKIDMTNNNSTTDFYVSSYSQIYYSETGSSDTGTIYIVGNVTPGSGSFTMTKYCGGGSNDWCLKIPAGQTVTLYFGSFGNLGRSNNNPGHVPHSDTYMTTLMLYGKFGTSDTPATRYAQNLPYIAWLGF